MDYYTSIANGIENLAKGEISKQIYLILRHIPAFLIIFLISRQSEIFHRISYISYIFYSAIRNGNTFMGRSDVNSWVFLSISAVIGSTKCMKTRPCISVMISFILSILVLNIKWIESLELIPLIACIVYLLISFELSMLAIIIVTFYSLMVLFHSNTAIECIKNGTHYSLFSITKETLIKILFILLLCVPISIIITTSIQIFVKQLNKKPPTIHNAAKKVSKYKKYRLISLISVSFIFLGIFQFYEPARSKFYLLSFISTFIELLFVNYIEYGIFVFIFTFMCYLVLNPLAEGLRDRRKNFYIVTVIFSTINGLVAISKSVINENVPKISHAMLSIIPLAIVSKYLIEFYDIILFLFVIKIISFFTFIIFE